MTEATQRKRIEPVQAVRHSFTLTDNETGESWELPTIHGSIGPKVIDIRKLYGQSGVFTYDPGFTSTASCSSEITYIDGDKGILEYRGYPIEQLAEGSTFLEVAYLLIHGSLPSKVEYEQWVHDITYHTFVHENVKGFMEGFRYDAHPMGMLMASVGALSTFYPEAGMIQDADNRQMQIIRMIAKMPTLGAWSFRHAQGKPFVYPDNDLSYTANFLSMLFKMSESKYEADERLVRALDTLFILHADHEQNCSTNAVRSVGSSQVDPYSAVAAGIGALYGPLHGGANEAVLRMLRRIGSKENIPDFIKGVKDGNERLMGFGHRVYRAEDPRARVLRRTAKELDAPRYAVAEALEQAALKELRERRPDRVLETNVEFWAAIVLDFAEVPANMFTSMFTCARTGGWSAHILEQKTTGRLIRPSAVYAGPAPRPASDVEGWDDAWA